MSDQQIEKQYDYHSLKVSAEGETKWTYEKDGNTITLEHLITEEQKKSWQIVGFGITDTECYPNREDAERKICQLLGVN